MKKITNYLYFFSKLSTSIFLFSVIAIMGYALLKSYTSVDNANNNIENKLNFISNSIFNQNSKITLVDKKLTVNENKLKSFEQLVKDLKLNLNNTKNQNDLLELMESNKKIKEDIKKIMLQLQKEDNSINLSVQNNKKIDSLLSNIMTKYKKGNDVSKELSSLKDSVSSDSNEIFEKISLIMLNKFYGYENLIKEFELASDKFVKKKFMDQNKNNMIFFLSKFIDIKPANISKFENEELNILNEAKNYMNSQEIQKTLNQILLLEDGKLIFKKWIEQANIYLDFNNQVKKVL